MAIHPAIRRLRRFPGGSAAVAAAATGPAALVVSAAIRARHGLVLGHPRFAERAWGRLQVALPTYHSLLRELTGRGGRAVFRPKIGDMTADAALVRFPQQKEMREGSNGMRVVCGKPPVEEE